MKNRIIELKDRIYFCSYGAVGGFEEKRGPLGDKFDFCDESDKFGQNTWELAEGEIPAEDNTVEEPEEEALDGEMPEEDSDMEDDIFDEDFWEDFVNGLK